MHANVEHFHDALGNMFFPRAVAVLCVCHLRAKCYRGSLTSYQGSTVGGQICDAMQRRLRRRRSPTTHPLPAACSSLLPPMPTNNPTVSFAQAARVMDALWVRATTSAT